MPSLHHPAQTGRHSVPGLDQFIEPLGPEDLQGTDAAQEAFDALLLSKLEEKRKQLDEIRQNRKKELAQMRYHRPIPTKSFVYDPTTYTDMQQLKKVIPGSSRYIVKEIQRKIPQARYLVKKKWFLGVRLVPLTERDRIEYEEQEHQRAIMFQQSKKIPMAEESSEDEEEGQSEASYEKDSPPASPKIKQRKSSGRSSRATVKVEDERSSSRASVKNEKPDIDLPLSPSPAPRRSTRGHVQSPMQEHSPSPTGDPYGDSMTSVTPPQSPPPIKSKRRTASTGSSSQYVQYPTQPTLVSVDSNASLNNLDDTTSAGPSPIQSPEQPEGEALDVAKDDPPAKKKRARLPKKTTVKSKYFVPALGPVGELEKMGPKVNPRTRTGLAGRLQTAFGSPMVAPQTNNLVITREDLPDFRDRFRDGVRVKRKAIALTNVEEDQISVSATSVSNSQAIQAPETPVDLGPAPEAATLDQEDEEGCKREVFSPTNLGSPVSATTVSEDPVEKDHDSDDQSSIVSERTTRKRRVAAFVAEAAMMTSNVKARRRGRETEEQETRPDLDMTSGDVEEMGPLTNPGPRPSLIFELGAVTSLAAIKDQFYPGRNSMVINKALQLRVPGCVYDRTKKVFINVAIEQVNS